MAHFKRIVPWILILVLSISLLPVTNAAAASSSVSGDWVLDGQIVWDEYVSFDLTFSAGGITFYGIVWDEELEQLSYLTEDSEGCVYDGLNGGWVNLEAASISISTDTQLDEAAYAFFTANAAPLLPLYANTIYIGDSSFVFVARGASPTVNIEVTSTGCTLSSDDDTQYWLYQGDADFLGFALNNGGDLMLEVGRSFICRGASGDHSSFRLYPYDTNSSSGGGSTPEEFYHFSGEWKFTGKIYWDEDLSVDIPFGSAEYECSSILWDAEREQLWYVTSDNDLCVYDGSSGWTHADFMTILVDGDIQLAEAAYEFFSSNAVQISTGGDSGGNSGGSGESGGGSVLYETIIVIDSYVYKFASYDAYPQVSISLTANGCSLSDGHSQYFWESNNLKEFLGLSLSMDASEPDYIIGDVWTRQGSEGNIVFQYYSMSVDDPDALSFDFVGWLRVAVGGFLSFELIPGLSLDAIVYFILVVKLLLWFLKVTT